MAVDVTADPAPIEEMDRDLPEAGTDKLVHQDFFNDFDPQDFDVKDLS